MSNMYSHLKRMMGAAEFVGPITEIHMGDWLGAYDRISITGKTADGLKFEMSLEIKKEEQTDGN